MRKDISVLIARIIIGGVFIYAGWDKVANIAKTVQNFSDMGIPAFLTYIVAYGELIGGVLVVLGLWTCIAAAFLAIVMLVAVVLMYKAGQPFAYPLVTLGGLVSIIGTCGGRFSVLKCSKCGSCSTCDSCGKEGGESEASKA